MAGPYFDINDPDAQIYGRYSTYEQYKAAVQSGQASYDPKAISAYATAGGVDITPPASMPLAPELTRSADRQKIAQRRRRGRASTMLSGAGLGGEGDSLG